jgi:tRNA G46 methylase TrmB
MLILKSPVCPAAMDWSTYYPAFVVPQESVSGNPTTDTVAPDNTLRHLVKDVEVADIGCGFGGLLVALAPMLPDRLLLGKTCPRHSQCHLNEYRYGDTRSGHRICPRTH